MENPHVCGWCEEKLMVSNMENHGCFSLAADLHIDHDNKVYPMDKDGRIFFADYRNNHYDDNRTTDEVYEDIERREKALSEQSLSHAIQNSENDERVKIHLLDHKSNITYTFLVSPKVKTAAVNDPDFALQLLDDHKRKMNINPSSKTTQDLTYHLRLYDGLENKTYDVYVDEKTFNEVHRDTRSAAELLEKHKNTISASLAASLSSDGECPALENESTWTLQAEKLLLESYKQGYDLYSAGKTTKNSFFKQIVDALKKKKYTFSMSQCSNKIESLKKKYKDVKSQNSKTGNDKKECEHFDILDDIFKSRPFMKPLSLAGSNLPLNEEDFCTEKKPVARKRKLDAVGEAKINYYEKKIKLEEIKISNTERRHQEKVANKKKHNEEKIKILKSLVGKELE